MLRSRLAVTAVASAILLHAASAEATPDHSPDAIAAPADATPTSAEPDWLLETSVLAALPAALPVGQSVGGAIGVHRAGWLSWGLVTSVSQAAENNLSNSVAHLEWRTRVVGGVALQRGRGALVLQGGLGATLVHETRLRHQSGRLPGGEKESNATALLPAAEIMAGARLRVFDSWGIAALAGPSWHGTAGGGLGFSALVGVLRWL